MRWTIGSLVLLLLLPVGAYAAGTLTAPAEATAGGTLTVKWNGDAAPTDFISIDKPGAPDRTYGAYGYPARTNPLTLAVPPQPGAYVIRYHLADTYAVTASAPLTVKDVSAQLNAPDTVKSGNELVVGWTGPNNQGDFISLDATNAADTAYGKYAYTSAGNPVKIPVQVAPGDYVVRYHLGSSGYRAIGSTPIRVVDVEASIDAPATIAAGAELAVSWTGPGGKGDFVSIDKAGAADNKYGKYAYATAGSPAKLRAPDEPGDYEVRYHLAGSYRVIGLAPINVGGVAATLSAPETVPAGGRFDVDVAGPNGTQDFVSLDPAGAPDNKYGAYAYAAKGTKLSLRAPDEPGSYQLRYHTGQTYKVLGARPITVAPVSASVSAPANAVAGRVFEAQWKGPNNEDDFITVVAAGAKDTETGPSNGYTKRGNPARIDAPKSAGAYELRYLTGQSRRVLARAPLAVTADVTPGRLLVTRGTGAAATAPSFGAVELVLDASGSMLQRIGGERRIDLAKKAFVALVSDVLTPGTPFAMRVFGTFQGNAASAAGQADSCRTDLEIPMTPLDRTSVVARIQSLEAKNLAKTPIADSLAKVKDDLAGAKAPLLVVLVTDGEETCGGDPKAAIAGLRAQGVATTVSIVGFAIDDVVLREAFQDWARTGGGGYFDADDGAELSAAVRAAVRTTYEVLSGTTAVATGTVDGDPITLPSGRYRLRLNGGDARDLGEVTIAAGEQKDLTF